MKVLDRITLNLSGDNRLVQVQAKQGDIKSRFIEVEFEHNGEPFIVPNGVTARAEMRKPDGFAVLNDEIVQDGKVFVELTEQMLASPGNALCDIQLYQDQEDTLLTSAAFIVVINPASSRNGNVESMPEGISFRNALLKLHGITNEAEDSAVRAAESAKTASNSAIKSTEAEENAAANASETAAAQNAAEKFAEVSSGYAKASEKSASNAAVSENDAANSAETANKHADRAKAEADRAAEAAGGDYVSRVKEAVSGNIPELNSTGRIVDSGQSVSTLIIGGRSIVPCEHVRNPETKTHVLTQTYPDQSLPESGVIPVSFIPTADFQAGDKFSFAGHEFTPQYENTTLAVADGAFRSGVAITINFQILPGGGG